MAVCKRTYDTSEIPGGDKALIKKKFLQINPTFTQHKLVDFCKQHSVLPVAYTPLGLISEARPEFIGKDGIKTDPKFGALADKYGKTRAQIGLRYLVRILIFIWGHKEIFLQF